MNNERGVERFLAAVAAEFDVSPPQVRFDVPINNEAQYVEFRTQIQYYDDAETLRALSEDGGVAPLRWTLHEFAHHLLAHHDKHQSEAFARWFTETYTPHLATAWREFVTTGDTQSVSLDTAPATDKLSDVPDQ